MKKGDRQKWGSFLASTMMHSQVSRFTIYVNRMPTGEVGRRADAGDNKQRLKKKDMGRGGRQARNEGNGR